MAIALLAGANGHVAAQAPLLTSPAQTADVDSTGADCIIIGTLGYAAGVASDNKSNAYNGLTAITSNYASESRLWYINSPSVGTGHHFLNSPSGSGFALVFALLVSGAHLSSPFDQENGTNGTSASATRNPGSITPSTDGEILVYMRSIHGDDANPVSVSVGTLIDSFAQIGGQAIGGMFAYEIQTTATSRNPDMVSSANGAFGATVIASFKPVATAAGPPIEMVTPQNNPVGQPAWLQMRNNLRDASDRDVRRVMRGRHAAFA